MPTVAFKSRIRARSECYALTLDVQHRLVTGTPSDALEMRPTRPPDELGVYGASSVAISLSGKLDGTTISAEKITSSQLAYHLVDYFRTNADELGFSAVSDIHLDKNDTPILMLTLSPPPITELSCPLVHLTLVGVDLNYNWKDESPQSNLNEEDIQANNNPFSQQLSLPFITLLDNVVGRFVTWQLVRRYPLIFGSWCKQLHTETTFFPPIFSSIMHMLQRSPHPEFRGRCRQLFKLMHLQAANISAVQLQALSSYLPDVERIESPVLESTDLEVFSSAMERVYRVGLRIPQFKGLSRVPCRNDDDDDELSKDHRQLALDLDFHNETVWNGSHEVLNHTAKLLESYLSAASPSSDFCWSETDAFEYEPVDEAFQAHPSSSSTTVTVPSFCDHLLQTDAESNFLWEHIDDWAQEETLPLILCPADSRSQTPEIHEYCLHLNMGAEQPSFQSSHKKSPHDQSRDYSSQLPRGHVSPSIFEVNASLNPLGFQTQDHDLSQEVSTLLCRKEDFSFQMSATNHFVEQNSLGYRPALAIIPSNDHDFAMLSDEEIKFDQSKTEKLDIRPQNAKLDHTAGFPQDYYRRPDDHLEWNIHTVSSITNADVGNSFLKGRLEQDPFLILDFL